MLLVFVIVFCLSLMVTPSLLVGLDQEVSMPEDSYVLKYFQVNYFGYVQENEFKFYCFQYQKDLMRIGAPVYWIIKGDVDYENETVQNLLCGGTGCSQISLSTQLYTASKQSELYLFIDSFRFD